MKTNNIRQCIISRVKEDKNSMIRFIIKEQNAILDSGNAEDARGYYIKRDIEILNSKKTMNILERKYLIKNIKEFIELATNSL
ncbi:MAG: DUF448 domain-containing protein [Mycoplasma sp.]